VWVPKLSGQESDVATATTFVPDPRAGHYWDGGAELVTQYDTVLALGQDAWDVYMIYGPDARWTAAAPPRPQFWMHQLHTRVGTFLDPNAFAAYADSLLLTARTSP
jgi:hypothetical protein